MGEDEKNLQIYIYKIAEKYMHKKYRLDIGPITLAQQMKFCYIRLIKIIILHLSSKQLRTKE